MRHMRRRKQHRDSIPSVARAASVGGALMPGGFAVLRVISSANFVGCIRAAKDLTSAAHSNSGITRSTREHRSNRREHPGNSKHACTRADELGGNAHK